MERERTSLLLACGAFLWGIILSSTAAPEAASTLYGCCAADGTSPPLYVLNILLCTIGHIL